LEQDEEVGSAIDDLLHAVRQHVRLKTKRRNFLRSDSFVLALTRVLANYMSSLQTPPGKSGRRGATRRKDLAKTIEDLARKIEDNDGDFHLSVVDNLRDLYWVKPGFPARWAGPARTEAYDEEIGEIEDRVVLAGERQDLFDFARLPATLRRYAFRLRNPLGPAMLRRHSHARSRSWEIHALKVIRESTGNPHFQKAAWLLHAAKIVAGKARPWKRGSGADKNAARALEARWNRYLKEVAKPL
jgi:hypothetical protein